MEPSCDIPSDVTFTILDEEGNKVGKVKGGHRKVMALKSTFFKAMFYGPMKDNRLIIPIRYTSLLAFQKMLS